MWRCLSMELCRTSCTTATCWPPSRHLLTCDWRLYSWPPTQVGFLPPLTTPHRIAASARPVHLALVLYPFHTYARMLRIGADRVRTKFRVESTEAVRNFVYFSQIRRRQHGESTEPVRMQQRMDKLAQISRG